LSQAFRNVVKEAYETYALSAMYSWNIAYVTSVAVQFTRMAQNVSRSQANKESISRISMGYLPKPCATMHLCQECVKRLSQLSWDLMFDNSLSKRVN